MLELEPWARKLETSYGKPLSLREFQVLDAVSQSESDEIAAEKLNISYQTVKNHLWHIRLKLGVTRTMQAVRLIFGDPEASPMREHALELFVAHVRADLEHLEEVY